METIHNIGDVILREAEQARANHLIWLRLTRGFGVIRQFQSERELPSKLGGNLDWQITRNL